MRQYVDMLFFMDMHVVIARHVDIHDFRMFTCTQLSLHMVCCKQQADIDKTLTMQKAVTCHLPLTIEAWYLIVQWGQHAIIILANICQHTAPFPDGIGDTERHFAELDTALSHSSAVALGVFLVHCVSALNKPFMTDD